MRDVGAPASGRLEQILERVDFFKPVATRRGFMQKLLLAGGAAAAGAAGLSKVMPALADTTTDFAAAAVGAERIGIAFYGNALGSGSPWSALGDPATTTLLNSSHRGYFQAAFNQETSHWRPCAASASTSPRIRSSSPTTPSDRKAACSPWAPPSNRSSSAPTWAR